VLLLVGAFVAVSVYQQHHLSDIVSEAGNRQQASITDVSEATMEAVLEQSLTKTTALQAYIAGDLFGDVKADVQTLQAFATELFAHEEQFSSHPFSPPLKEKDGVPSVYVLHEEGADPQDSGMLGLIANMSEVMMARFSASDKLSGCFVGTADGNLLAVNDRAGVCLAEDGTPQTIDVRNRPWYRQAAEAGELIFTGVELDSYTGFATLECAAPVYKNGELVCVVGADIFLTAINDYIVNTSTDESFLFVVSDKGQVLFSPATEGTLKAEHSAAAADLRQSENGSLAGIVKDSLSAATGLRTVTFDGKEYQMFLDKFSATDLDLSYTFNFRVPKSLTVGLSIYNVFSAEYDNNGWTYCELSKDANGKIYAWNTDEYEAGFAPSAPITAMLAEGQA